MRLNINEKQNTGVFTFENTGLIKEGDNLFTTQSVSLEEAGAPGYGIRPALGFISRIHGNEVFVKCIPAGLNEGIMQLYVVEYPVFIPPVWGTLTANNSTITDVISYSHSLYPKAGTRIFGIGFPNGVYVLETNPESRTITMSANALQSVNEAYIRNSAYDQNVYIENWSDQSVPVIKEGAVIHLEKPFHSSYRLVNTKKAVQNTPYKASLKPIE